MSDAAQINALKNIGNQLTQVVRVLTAMNENMVSVAKMLKPWLEAVEEAADQEQLELDLENTRRIQFFARWSEDGTEHEEQVAEGFLRRRPDDTYEIEVFHASGEGSKLWALPPGGPWKLAMFFRGQVYDYNVPSFESGIKKVYGSLHE